MKRVLSLLLGVQMLASSACAGPVLMTETVVRRNGATVYSSLDPRRGEVVFRGLRNALVAEADVAIDGQPMGTVRSGGWIPVYLATLGRHQISAKIYLIQGGQRADQIGCFNRQVQISPYHRSSSTYGFWWRVDIYPSPYC